MKTFIAGLVAALVIPHVSISQDLVSENNSQVGNWDNPHVFIENHGQFPVVGKKDANVLYAFDNGMEFIYFRRDGFSYSFMSKKPKKNREEQEREERETGNLQDWQKHEMDEHAVVFKQSDVYVTFEGANSDVQVTSSDMTPDYYSYAIKENATEYTINENRAYRKLYYTNLYDRIDVEFVFHENGGIKYTIIVHPGGDVSQVKMKYTGAKKLWLDKAGQVHIETPQGDILDHSPVSFLNNDPSQVVTSAFVKNGNLIAFNVSVYDHHNTLVIDPWQLTSGLGFGNSNRVWECEHDNSANSYFWGGDTPNRLKKYNSAGVLQWTYNSTWDTANFWVGTLITDNAGNSFITGGSNGEIRKVNTSGASVWYNNPNGAFGPLFEYWHLAFNCDQTNLLIGGMRMPNPFSTSQFRGVTITINMGSGAVTGFTVVGWIAGLNIKEVRSICSAPNGDFYFLTLDSIGCVSSTNTLLWKSSSTYNFSYGNPSYSIQGNMGVSAIRANSSAIYTMNGTTLHKRSTANGAILGTVAIPGGIGSSSAFGNTMGCSGLDIDSCGNVYVGSGNAIIKYDANLNQLSTQSTPGVVYDVSVSKNGEVVACGNGWMGTYNMGNCNPMQAICVTSSLTATSTQANINCFGSCTGSATASPSGGTSPYTYAWSPSGGNAATANSLCAGTYTCTITDATSATTTVVVTITQPAIAVSATQSQGSISCSGGTTTASVSASGGTPGYTYSWAPSGGTGATSSAIGAGTYTCTITDANGCTLTKTFNITAPPALTATSSSTNLICNAVCNGTASVNASGGTPSYTYSWAPSGGSGVSASSLCAGTYTCTITDAGGCTTTQSFNITQPTAVTATASSTPTACAASSGTATVSPGGGTPGYTYSWAPSGGTGATANNLVAGSYTCTVTDANGCTTTAITTVTSSGGPTTSVQSTTDVLCNGNSTGTAAVSATGNGPFTYSWSPSGGTGASASNLGAGTYTVTITDVNGCVSAQTLAITEPTPLVSSPTETDATCGNNNGTADANASGGTGPYTYAWSNSATTATISNLAGGSYSVIITDANGCTTSSTVTVGNTGAPNVAVTSTTDPACNGASTGSATVTASAGSPPYTYAWSPSGGTSATATNLPAGTYTVTVTGSDGCAQTQTLTLTQPTAIASTTASTPESCGANDGTVSVNVSGGTGPYTYLWSNSSTNDTITGLSAGNFSVTITDANGCTSFASVNVGSTGSATANAGTSVTIISGSSTTLNGSGSGSTFTWSPGGSLSCTNCQSPVASPTVTTTYTLTVTDSLGCTAMDTVTVIVDVNCGDIWVPNAFSPNGDHENDILFVRGNCIDVMVFKVFNRWGECVWTATDVTDGWDGTWRGKPCEAAVFTYYLRATTMTGQEFEQQGSISLVK